MCINLIPHALQKQKVKFRPFVVPEKSYVSENLFLYFKVKYKN